MEAADGAVHYRGIGLVGVDAISAAGVVASYREACAAKRDVRSLHAEACVAVYGCVCVHDVSCICRCEVGAVQRRLICEGGEVAAACEAAGEFAARCCVDGYQASRNFRH